MARNFYNDYSNNTVTLMDGDTGLAVGLDPIKKGPTQPTLPGLDLPGSSEKQMTKFIIENSSVKHPDYPKKKLADPRLRPSRKVLEQQSKKELNIHSSVKATGRDSLDWINYVNKLYGNNQEPLTAREKYVGETIENKQWETPSDPASKKMAEYKFMVRNNPNQTKTFNNSKLDKWKYTSRLDEMVGADKITDKIEKKKFDLWNEIKEDKSPENLKEVRSIINRDYKRDPGSVAKEDLKFVDDDLKNPKSQPLYDSGLSILEEPTKTPPVADEKNLAELINKKAEQLRDTELKNFDKSYGVGGITSIIRETI